MRGLSRKNKAAEDEVAGVVRITHGGEVYEIPVDERGFVPTWALAQRFQEVGDFDDDIEDTSEMVLPADCTPAELINWWIDPSSCDIEGVDTEDSPIYDVESCPDELRDVQRRFAVIASPSEQKRIRKILSEAFSPDELRQMAANGSLVIRTVPYMDGATGCYYRSQDGNEVPLIVLEEGTTDDGIVHEMVHHSRAVDKRRHGKLKTTFPSNRKGRLNLRKFSRLSKRKQDKIVEEEERMTVAETAVRTRTDPVQSGYYDGVPGKNPRAAYIEDRYILTDTPPNIPPSQIPRLTGRAARNATLHGYEYTNVARAKILSRNVRKR